MKNPFRKRWEVYTVRKDNGKEFPVDPALRSMHTFWREDSAQLFANYGNFYSQFLKYQVRRLP